MAAEGKWRLGHRPALDGLRGIAILLVLSGHVFDPPAALMFDGVSVFFALSGFLITSLLVERHAREGRWNLADFYKRRAVRLLPALAGLLAGLSVLSAVVERGLATPSSVLAAALYYGNWAEASQTLLAPGLTHTWSLSVEEQFYVVWPLVLIVAARWGRRGMIGVTAGLLAASLGWKFTLLATGTDLGRVYFGSDTRADGLLIGCLLALVMAGRREGHSRPMLAATAGSVGLFLVSASMVFFDGHWLRLALVPTITALATAVLVWCSAQGAGVRWLSVGWLRVIGERSYALYLWHVPVLVTLEQADAPMWLTVTVGPLISWALTCASWRWVERPAQAWAARGKSRPRAGSNPAATASATPGSGHPADAHAA